MFSNFRFSIIRKIREGSKVPGGEISCLVPRSPSRVLEHWRECNFLLSYVKHE